MATVLARRLALRDLRCAEGDAAMKLPGYQVRGEGPWRLQLICCGHEDGIECFESWDDADTFRKSYTATPDFGHKRSAILTKEQPCC